MARANPVKFSEFIVKIGDGGSPSEAFAAPCGITTRSLNRSAERSIANLPDCDNEDLPSVQEGTVTSTSWTITGSGLLTVDALDTWDDWFESGAERNVQVTKVGAGANGGRTWSGRAHLTTLNYSGSKEDNGGKMQIEVEIAGQGELTRVNAA